MKDAIRDIVTKVDQLSAPTLRVGQWRAIVAALDAGAVAEAQAAKLLERADSAEAALGDALERLEEADKTYRRMSEYYEKMVAKVLALALDEERFGDLADCYRRKEGSVGEVSAAYGIPYGFVRALVAASGLDKEDRSRWPKQEPGPVFAEGAASGYAEAAAEEEAAELGLHGEG